MSLNNLSTLNSTESQKEWNNNFSYDEKNFNQKLEEINREKIALKKAEDIACFIKKAELSDNKNDKEVLEYLKLLETTPEQINIWEFIKDLTEWDGFGDNIREKLKSNLVNSISADDIYREYSSKNPTRPAK